MNVEFTGRQYEITPAIRKSVETGLAKIRKILGDKFETKVILAVEKHRHKAEITISPRNGPLVGLAQARDMKHPPSTKPWIIWKSRQSNTRPAGERKTFRAQESRSKKWNGNADHEELQTAVGLTEKTAVPVVVHKFPAVAKSTEVHLVRSDDAVAMRPMTLEEAIKEAHFRDRDVFVFRDPKGKVMVLHRTRTAKWNS